MYMLYYSAQFVIEIALAHPTAAKIVVGVGGGGGEYASACQ